MPEIGSTRHQQLRNLGTVGTAHTCVVDTDHVENHTVVCTVGGMAVAPPVGSPHMQLHVAGPHPVAYSHLGVEEIRPRPGIGQAGVEHIDTQPVDRPHHRGRPQAVVPYIVHQFLHTPPGA